MYINLVGYIQKGKLKKVKILRIFMDKRGLTHTDLLILKELKNKNLGVMELSDNLRIPHKTIKPHLDHLKKFKIVKFKQDGKKQEHSIIQNKRDLIIRILKIFKFLGK